MEWTAKVTVNGQRIQAEEAVNLELNNGESNVEGRALVLDMKTIGLLLSNNVLKKFKRLEVDYEGEKPELL